MICQNLCMIEAIGRGFVQRKNGYIFKIGNNLFTSHMHIVHTVSVMFSVSIMVKGGGGGGVWANALFG